MLKSVKTTAVILCISITTITASPSNSTAGEAKVSEVYPTSNILPENLLRFYLYFSKPMMREETVAAVYLANAEGKKLEGVFLTNRFSLWNPDGRRLTLLFDPGRVKTGLVAHNRMGRALKPDNLYQLVVSTTARDAQGKPLAKEFRKSFRVEAETIKKPDVSKWTIHSPVLRSRDPLIVDLNGKMDHLSLAYRLRILDGKGKVVSGSIQIGKGEQQWLFTPQQPWKKATYKLSVDPRLEDIVGNRLSGLFDQPSLARESKLQEKKTLLPFTPVINDNNQTHSK